MLACMHLIVASQRSQCPQLTLLMPHQVSSLLEQLQKVQSRSSNDKRDLELVRASEAALLAKGALYRQALGVLVRVPAVCWQAHCLTAASLPPQLPGRNVPIASSHTAVVPMHGCADHLTALCAMARRPS